MAKRNSVAAMDTNRLYRTVQSHEVLLQAVRRMGGGENRSRNGNSGSNSGSGVDGDGDGDGRGNSKSSSSSSNSRRNAGPEGSDAESKRQRPWRLILALRILRSTY